MKLNLQKPLIVFDLETTGLDISKDRVIQISYIKVTPDGEEKRVNLFVNPERAIPQEVQALTHITDDMVKDAPTFAQIVGELEQDFENCDFAGYNSNNFDIPILAEEMLRAGSKYDLSKARLIDSCTIFKQMEKRNLAAAYKFYCGRKMEDDFQAHLASEDAEATYCVLKGQLDMYAPGKQDEPERQLENDMQALHDFCNLSSRVDFAGRIVFEPVKGADGQPVTDANGQPHMREVFSFGKYKGWAVADVLRRDPGYISWMMTGDFPMNTKQVLTRIKMRESGGRLF